MFADSAGTYHDYDDIVAWLKVAHPGQLVIPLNINNGVVSGGCFPVVGAPR